MKQVSFVNQGEIDIRAISHFGLHAKQSESAIGYFGTGLKYALAVLVRTGHKIEIFSGLERYTIELRHGEFRGKSLDFIISVDPDGTERELGFTTELAKDWELWAAYRELACNCYDENGTIHDGLCDPADGFTTIIITGDDFHHMYGHRAEIILESEPIHSIKREPMFSFEMHAGRTDHMHYRGIRALKLELPALYTYNITSKCALTEDRTLKISPKTDMAWAYLTCTDHDVLKNVLTASRDTFEGRLDFDWSVRDPCKEFCDVVIELSKDRATDINSSALSAVRRATESDFVPTPAVLSAVEQSKITKAADFVTRHGYDVRRYPIHAVESLGRHTLAAAYDGGIYLTRKLINMGGATKLASALIEEYLHLRYDLEDESRELQTFLFEKLVSVYEELDGEAL